MLDEAVDYLECKEGGIYVDCTLGGAGHSEKILQKIGANGILIGIDADPEAIKNGEKLLKDYKNIKLFNDNFQNIKEVLLKSNIEKIEGIIADLGFSLYQMKDSGRGFSFNDDEALDMRYNPIQKIKASDIINNFKEEDLAKIFRDYGEERYSSFIAEEIVKKREKASIKSSLELAEIVRRAVLKKRKKIDRHIDLATRVFMALRIAVNDELKVLDRLLSDAVSLLKPGGRMSIISFHSLEHKIIKLKIRQMGKGCVCPSDFPKCVCEGKKEIKIITKKPIIPSEYEIEKNRMARSAQLRVFEKI